jgi:glycosyltransferase involved in cell wall biosynthesis
VKILFVTNYYPPANNGLGYMQLCEEVANGLAERGHDIAVLTSASQSGPEPTRIYPVYRWLTIDPDWESRRPGYLQFFSGRRSRERHAVESFRRVYSQFEPQIIFVWHAIGLPKVMLLEAEDLSGPRIVYYLADYQAEIGDEYIAYWSGNPSNPLSRILKYPIRMMALSILKAEGKPIKLKYEHAICVSQYVRDRLVRNGFIPPESVVIHNGIDLTQFSPDGRKRRSNPDSRLRCLVAGRIIPHKGVHTVVQAFAHLRRRFGPEDVTLTIIGDGPQDYLARLQEVIIRSDLQDMVNFRNPVPRSQMPEVLSGHDALILASEYDEPLARAIQEAMAMELLVIGTTTGGSGELLIADQTGLIFPAGDSLELANQITRAITHPDLVNQLAKAGRKAVEENFDIRKTVSKIEMYLQDLIA